MNISRATLQRRRFLQSGSVLGFGAISSLCAGRKLLQLPTHLGATRRQSPASPVPSTPDLNLADQQESPLPVPDAPWETEPSPPLGRPLELEDSFRDFLLTLNLRHLSAEEIIDPHRGVLGGVENTLPPVKLWEKLAPTLKVADELRERLQTPMCRITSGYRSPRYNAKVPGAVKGSYHTRNQALDLVYFCSPRKAFDAALQLRREGFFRGGVGLYPTFIHLDTRGYAATWRKV
ncbi:MAG TPA: hypothetical protein DIV39_03120 [Verrucomicrobiales bacterium]|nr:hypothetical protein [Verrucomicrobiales bacterium]